MHIRTLLIIALFFTSQSVLFSQSVSDLLGKSMAEGSVAKFVQESNLDPVTGLSYSKGVQIFQENGLLQAIYLFNKGTVNGADMNAYGGVLPLGLSFSDNPAGLKKKLGEGKEENGHWVWDKGDYRIEVAYTDEKQSSISYILFEKK